MKTNIVYSLCVSMGILFILQTSCKPKPTAENKIEYTKDAVFPKYMEAQMSVYNVPTDYQPNQDEFQSFLNRAIKLSGDTSKLIIKPDLKAEDGIWYSNPKDPSALIKYNLQNGDIIYDKGVKDYLNNQTTPQLLKNEKAVARAREYIKELNFQIKDSELSVAHIGGMNTAVFDGKQSTIYEKFTTVRFDRLLDKIPVYGHARIIVQMAEEGKLEKVIRQWTPLKAVALKSSDLLSTKEMKKRLEQSVISENTEATKVRIVSLTLVYFDKGTGIIEPAIRVLGKTINSLTDQDGKSSTKEFPYDTVIPLLKVPKLSYPFAHDNLANKPASIDKEDMKSEIKRSEDDINKKQ
jgi:hypothetical protein